MFKFLIEVNDNNEIMFDFQFFLIEHIKFQKWFNESTEFDYEYLKYSDINLLERDANYKYIPIGSLDFVFTFMKKHPKPLNIPKELMVFEFLGRYAKVLNGSDINIDKKMFIKENTKYKGFLDFVDDVSLLDKDTSYLVSDIVNIESEWRTFILDKEILDIKNYSGSNFNLPDKHKIQKMIDVYQESPLAYTLDVAVTNTGETIILEVHPFVSCGLYGFNHKKLIRMFIEGYKYMESN